MAAPAITAEVPAIDRPPRRRRWIPVSLRVFVGLLVLSTAWACYGAYRRHTAVQEIERLGGMVGTSPRRPAWLVSVLDSIDQDLSERCDVVTFACLHSRPANDATVSQLAWLTDLEELVLSGTQVTDGGLQHLKGMTRLKRVSLGRTRVTEAGIADLQQALPGLTVHR
jgi:hypothetical protein